MQSSRTRAGRTEAQFEDMQWNLFRPLIIRWSKVQILAGPPTIIDSYPANLSNPAFQQTGQIQQLVRQLEGLGFTNQPKFPKQQSQRVFVEVFPSPAQVILFPCLTHSGHTHCRRLWYKHKPGRSWLEVKCEWDMYRARLRSLQTKEPALKLSPEVKKVLNVDVSDLTEPDTRFWMICLTASSALILRSTSGIGERSGAGWSEIQIPDM